MSLVWITRAQPGAAATAARVERAGRKALVSPVLEVRSLDPAIDVDGVAALAFTSANGVRAFAGGRHASLLTGGAAPVFTVGEATAEAARAAGVEEDRLVVGGGDARALAERIAAAPPAGMVLHPGAREPAADLAALLAERGVRARSAAVYETVAREPVEALARLDDIGALLVHSARAAAQVARVLEDNGARPTFFCISGQAAAPLIAAGHEKVFAAPFPDEAALLKLLSDPPERRS